MTEVRDAPSKATAVTVLYVCVRADHHRRRSTSGQLRENDGRAAYCPAGDAQGHDWMPALTDTLRLGCLGLCPPECPRTVDAQRQRCEERTLINA